MKKGRPKNDQTVTKMSISLRPMIYDELQYIVNVSGLKRSQIIAMAIHNFYKACMEKAEE